MSFVKLYNINPYRLCLVASQPYRAVRSAFRIRCAHQVVLVMLGV